MLISVTCHPYANRISAKRRQVLVTCQLILKPCLSHRPVTCHPYLSNVSATYQPYVSSMPERLKILKTIVNSITSIIIASQDCNFVLVISMLQKFSICDFTPLPLLPIFSIIYFPYFHFFLTSLSDLWYYAQPLNYPFYMQSAAFGIYVPQVHQQERIWLSMCVLA